MRQTEAVTTNSLNYLTMRFVFAGEQRRGRRALELMRQEGETEELAAE